MEAFSVAKNQKINLSPFSFFRLLSTTLEELFGQQQETTVRKRGPAPKWQQQLEAIDQLPKSQQKFVAHMLDALIAQATTKANSEGREILQ